MSGRYGAWLSQKATKRTGFQYREKVGMCCVCALLLGYGYRFLQGPEIPERQLYKEPPEAFLEADCMEEVRVLLAN